MSEAPHGPPTGEGAPRGRIEQGFAFIERFPWKRVVLWGIFLGFLYLLRDFFDVLFFTFLFSFLFGKAVDWLAKRAGKEDSPGFRKGVVLGMYLVLLGGIGAGLYVAYPHIVAQGRVLVAKVSGFASGEAALAPKAGDQAPTGPGAQPMPERYKQHLPHAHTDRAPRVGVDVHLHDTQIVLPAGAAQAPKPKNAWTTARVERLLRQFLGDEDFIKFKKTSVAGPTINAAKNILNEVMPSLTRRLAHFFQNLLRWILHLFLALVFSLIILVDFPNLRAQVASLADSRVGDLYRELAPSLTSFGAILGKSFQAQALIAIANTVLTAIGIFAFGLPHPFILTAVVFACSFIPVVGVMISTLPMALVAVQAGGPMLALYIALWVIGVHFVEAYFLNPKIVGNFMHMHPIVVLVILVVAEHSFGMWGLLLGVPVCFFLYHHFIKGDDEAIAKMSIRPSWRKRLVVSA